LHNPKYEFQKIELHHKIKLNFRLQAINHDGFPPFARLRLLHLL
jgi:hypothetical protein